MKRAFAASIGAAAVAGAVALGVVYSGVVDVAATTAHSAPVRWLLSTAMAHSVARHAEGITVPADLDAPARIEEGFSEYDGMCVGCHGAPGIERGEVGEGLNPEPPALDRVAHQWSAAELYWITKHGVRMTGMPAFGPSHDDEELWDTVAFVRQLPETTPGEYQRLRQQASPDGHAHAHHHEHGDAGMLAPED